MALSDASQGVGRALLQINDGMENAIAGCSPPYVRYWHLADVYAGGEHVRF